jgi:hypothetical protein
MDVLARARAYRDAYSIRRRRGQLSLLDDLRERYVFDLPEPDGYDDELLDQIASDMLAHPSVHSVEVDHGVLSGGPYRFVVAYGRVAMLARVDVEPDGTLRLLTPE